MSHMNILHTMERIRGTPSTSPLAVFQAGNGFVNVVFANTVVTKRLLASQDPMLIGVFDGTMDPRVVRAKIEPYTLMEIPKL
jgi:hypothetical protein